MVEESEKIEGHGGWLKAPGIEGQLDEIISASLVDVNIKDPAQYEGERKKEQKRRALGMNGSTGSVL